MPHKTSAATLERVRRWQQNHREQVNRIAREYYWKNVERLRKVCAERQRKYARLKHPRKLSDNPVAVYQRKQRKQFKLKHGISWNQVYRNGKNALIAVQKAERKCQQCGSMNNLSIHHKDGNGRNKLLKGLKPNNELNNLMVLCRSCHAILHGSQNRGR